jgi:hypothetical protein
VGTFTYYLTVREEQSQCRVTLERDTPLEAIRAALEHAVDLRYSPILPAYLSPGAVPAAPPVLETITFYFARRPYQVLGKLRPGLTQDERDRVFFTEGLASILVLNASVARSVELRDDIGCDMERWTLRDGVLNRDEIEIHRAPVHSAGLPLNLSATGDDTVDVYVEQIAASITTLWSFYSAYLPSECATLSQLLELTRRLVNRHALLRGDSMDTLRQRNAIVSALVELSASLSYSVTQGTTGSSPILANRSPFPHHSLLGIAGAVRALTNFTRYLEAAFRTRSASAIIQKQYATKQVAMPGRISTYDSGANYAFDLPAEEFDQGGDFSATDTVPLLTHFSLRHGFKEAKFSITAASESLTAECLPAWTLMTLSHEIMHSRVRDIFQALFGTTWTAGDAADNWDQFFRDFAAWYQKSDVPVPVDQGLRNVILNFCCATDRATIVQERSKESELGLTRDDLFRIFIKHRRLAGEYVVHFHDYYFAYARQPKLYVMSLWASWTTVAAPVARPMEYVVRTLVTIACGTGASPRDAFAGAGEELIDGIDALEAAGITSPLFAELRRILDEDSEKAFALFKPAYYLIDQVRKNFASPSIAALIDRLETDPFADGSTVAQDYAASIYVYGERETFVSPIRYSLAALVRQLSANQPVHDLQWLTAWNSLVISSQEVGA